MTNFHILDTTWLQK